MEEVDKKEMRRKDRMVTIRFTQEDYTALLFLSKTKGRNVSEVIRRVLDPITEMVKEK